MKKMKKRPGKVKVDKSASKIPVSLRVDGGVLADLKTEAERKGIPYQTLINSILFQYSTGDLIETRTVDILKKLKAS